MRQNRRSQEEQLNLITECRSSGLTDREWCEGKGIPQSTFYAWIGKLKRGNVEIPKTDLSYPVPHKAQDVVRLSVPSSIEKLILDEPIRVDSKPSNNEMSTLMIEIEDVKIHVKNGTDPLMLAQTLKILRGLLC